MSGGSRYGAGRPGWRGRCEQRQSLDIRVLARKGLLRPNARFSWSWNRNGEPAGSVTVSLDEGVGWLKLEYIWTRDGETTPVSDAFMVTHTPCNYGGRRPWLRCRWCAKRCAVIYGLSGDGRFGCRKCLRLGYTSESESPLDRAWRKTRKIEALLAEDGERPTGMRLRTYNLIVERLNEAEARKDDLWMVGAARMLACFGAPMRLPSRRSGVH